MILAASILGAAGCAEEPTDEPEEEVAGEVDGVPVEEVNGEDYMVEDVFVESVNGEDYMVEDVPVEEVNGEDYMVET